MIEICKTMLKQKLRFTSFALIVIASATSIQAQNIPSQLTTLFDCETIDDSNARLSCFENASRKLEIALKNGEIISVSNATVKEVERDAFGFNIPSLPSLGNLFRGDSAKAEPPISTLKPPNGAENSTITSTAPKPYTTQPTTSDEITKSNTDEVKSVALEIARVKKVGHNKLKFYMENGQIWQQTDSTTIRIPKTRNSDKNIAKITKASLGSFLLRVNGKGRTARVKRVK